MSGALSGAVGSTSGPRSGKLDSALVNLRSRFLDLHARLAELHESLLNLRDGVGPDRTASWPPYMSKFDTLCKLFSQLTKELERATTEVGLGSFILEPRAVAEDSGLVPELLRTKLMPEMEKELQEFQEECRRDMTGIDGVGVVGKEKVESRVREFNAFVGLLLERFTEMREELAPEREKDRTIGANGKVAPAQVPTKEQIDRVLHAIDRGVGLAPASSGGPSTMSDMRMSR